MCCTIKNHTEWNKTFKVQLPKGKKSLKIKKYIYLIDKSSNRLIIAQLCYMKNAARVFSTDQWNFFPTVLNYLRFFERRISKLKFEKKNSWLG